MYTSFWKVKPYESEELRRYMCSSLYREETDEQYAASGYWADLCRRTFVALNGDVVMLRSGHRFIAETTLDNRSLGGKVRNGLIRMGSRTGTLLGVLARVHSYIGRSLEAAEEMKRRRLYREIVARLRFPGESSQRGREVVPGILSEAVRYNESKVYDSIENISYIERVVETNASPQVFLEIGAGAGLTSLLLIDRVRNSRVVICDLPVTICVGYTLACFFGRSRNLRVLLPHQVSKEVLNTDLFEIALITPDQLGLLGVSSVDGIINVHSMQEMRIDTIRSYFRLIGRVGKERGFFFCKNLERSRQYGDTIMENYPWEILGEIIVDDVAEYATAAYAGGREAVRIRIVRVGKSGERGE